MANKPSCINAKGECSKGFPKPYSNQTIIKKDGYPTYTRISPANGGFTFQKNGKIYTDAWVSAYNPFALLKYRCHLNVECVASILSYKYINKYICKGVDMISAEITHKHDQNASDNIQNANDSLIRPQNNPNSHNNDNNNNHEEQKEEKESIDEITKYVSGRYITPHSAAWRLMELPLHESWPPVECLDVHLDGEQFIYYKDEDDEEQLLSKIELKQQTKLTEFFKVCKREKEHPLSDEELNGGKPATELCYSDMPQYFAWQNTQRCWKRRPQRRYRVGRVYRVPPQQKERFYLRLLLTKIQGPTSYADLKKYDGEEWDTFQEAAAARGYVENMAEYYDCMSDAAEAGTPTQIRKLFFYIIKECQPTTDVVQKMWEDFKHFMSEDILYRRKQETGIMNMEMSDDICNHALYLIECDLQQYGLTLNAFGLQPRALDDVSPLSADYVEETSWNKRLMQSVVDANLELMKNNPEQLKFYEDTMKLIRAKKNNPSAPGPTIACIAAAGTGKTFVSNTILAAARAEGVVCLPVASSGLAAMLLKGGRTAHSRFNIPIGTLDDTTMLKLKKHVKKLIREAQVIIWDEFTMQHKSCFEAVDRALRDLMDNNLPWGGKIVIITGI